MAVKAGRESLRQLLISIASDESRELARQALAPLLSYDAEHGGDLVHTLRVYFSLNSNTTKAADRLFLHRNGLIYRLNRIEELLGISLADAKIRLPLELAVYLLETEDTTDAHQRPQPSTRNDYCNQAWYRYGSNRHPRG